MGALVLCSRSYFPSISLLKIAADSEHFYSPEDNVLKRREKKKDEKATINSTLQQQRSEYVSRYEIDFCSDTGIQCEFPPDMSTASQTGAPVLENVGWHKIGLINGIFVVTCLN